MRILEFIIGTILIIVTAVILIWIIPAVRKKRYEKDFNSLFSQVSYYVVNEHNFKKISKLFRELRMNDQNPEQTNALWSIFQERFNEYLQDNTKDDSKFYDKDYIHNL